jgi:MFS family permease
LPRFSPTVWLLGWVSFFTDLGSEIIYPLLPLFLTRVLGAGAMSLGVIEGVAEAANSALKILSGHLSDRWNARKPLVLGGYTLSSAVRPLMGIATGWTHVLGLRFIDRLGKGIRGAPRDALLAQITPADRRGAVYGLQRGMDHAGAVAGPLLASAYLFFRPEDFRTLFFLTIVPGVIVVVLLLRLQEPPAEQASASKEGLTLAGWRSIPGRLWTFLGVLVIFTLGNASDAFLLLRLSDLGVAAFWIPVLWSALHVVKSTSSVFGGALADRIGRRSLIVSGWVVYALVYFGFATFTSPGTVIALFIGYGLYYGMTEAPERAVIADLTPAGLGGTAFGLYNAALGVGALLASLLFGFIWTRVSPPAAFVTGGALALSAAAALVITPTTETQRRGGRTER